MGRRMQPGRKQLRNAWGFVSFWRYQTRLRNRVFFYSLLSQVDLLVPLAPDLGRGEHATGSAHVTEGSLTSTVSSASRDTRNTGNSATCEVFQSAFPFSASKQFHLILCFSSNRVDSVHPSCPLSCSPPSSLPNMYKIVVLTSSPRLSRGLVTSLLSDGVWLTLVLGHSGVDSPVEHINQQLPSYPSPLWPRAGGLV